ncbi:MAG: hypothetical protein HUJ26_24135 [Planctomycetaceae bacterium]|nr:hypothetical protein [Planctomycetaceae bacterium]
MNDDSIAHPKKSKWRRRCLLLLLGGGVLLGVAFWLLWQSSQSVPEFYGAALDDPEVTPEIAVEVKERTQNLIQEIESTEADERVWTETLTDRECNAWLAYEFPKLFPDAEREGLSDPRIHFEEDRILLGCRLDTEKFSGVVSFVVRPQIETPHQLSLQVLSARVGQIPLPLETLIDEAFQELHEDGSVLPQVDIDWQASPQDRVNVEGAFTISPAEGVSWPIEMLSVQIEDNALTFQGRRLEKSRDSASLQEETQESEESSVDN